MKLDKVKDIVLQVLSRSPETRDSDPLLILKVWAHQNPKLRELDFTFVEFSHEFLAGNYYPTGSIVRNRRKLQEMNEHLQGERYHQRKTEEADEVKSELKSVHWMDDPEATPRNH